MVRFSGTEKMLWVVIGAVAATVGYMSFPSDRWPVDKISHTNEINIQAPAPEEQVLPQ